MLLKDIIIIVVASVFFFTFLITLLKTNSLLKACAYGVAVVATFYFSTVAIWIGSDILSVLIRK